MPIDGVGLEMHIGANGSYPTLEQLETVMGQYRDLGLRVALTELDALKPVGPWDGTAQRAADDVVAEACREMSNCVSVNVWGVADQYSWRGVDQHADLVWTTFSPKNTYTDVRCRLNDPMPATGTWTPVACPAQQAPLAAAMTMPTGPTSGPSTGSEPAVGPPPGG